MIALILPILKIILFFIDFWKERDQEKSRKKAAIAKEIVNVFQETDKKKQASRLNAIVGSINRV